MSTYLGLKLMIASIVGLVALGAGIKRAAHVAERRRRMRAAKRVHEDNTPVTLAGKVKLLGEPLEAPLSGKRCVAYRATARVYERRGRYKHVTHELVATKLVPFVLETAEGDIHVDVVRDSVEFVLAPSPLIPRKLEREQRFVRELGVHATDCGFDEIAIQAGMAIAVHGIGRVELSAAAAAAETDYRTAPSRLRIIGDASHPLTIDRA